MSVFFLGAVSAIVSLLATAGVRHLAIRCNALDVPDPKKGKLHPVATPLWGGVGLLLAFVVLVAGIEGIAGFFTQGNLEPLAFWSFLFGILVLLLGGMLDDVVTLPPKYSVIFPLGSATLVALGGMGVAHVTNPLGGVIPVIAWIIPVITFCWVLCTTYTTKILDGVDGLVTVLGLVGSGLIGALALMPQWYQPDIALLSWMFFGALLGFFVWNAPPAKIFLGEGGSTGIGFTLGCLAIMGGSKFATLLLILGFPALDIAYVMFSRIQSGQSPFRGGDGRHFHSALRRRGFTSLQILFIYAGVALSFGLLTLILSPKEKLLALGVLFLGTLWTLVTFPRTRA